MFVCVLTFFVYNTKTHRHALRTYTIYLPLIYSKATKTLPDIPSPTQSKYMYLHDFGTNSKWWWNMCVYLWFLWNRCAKQCESATTSKHRQTWPNQLSDFDFIYNSLFMVHIQHLRNNTTRNTKKNKRSFFNVFGWLNFFSGKTSSDNQNWPKRLYTNVACAMKWGSQCELAYSLLSFFKVGFWMHPKQTQTTRSDISTEMNEVVSSIGIYINHT